MKRQSGYTLVELLVAISLFSLIAAAVGTAGGACLRLCQTSIVEAELSIRARELREKLLFHIRQPSPLAAYDGLLSAPATSRIDSVAFYYNGEQLPFSNIPSGNRTRQSHRLLLAGQNDMTYPMDDHAPHDAANLRWLKPGGFYLDGSAYTTEQFITPIAQTTRNGYSRAYIYLALTASATDGTLLGKRDEVLIVPFLNSAQEKVDDLVSHIGSRTNSIPRGSWQ